MQQDHTTMAVVVVEEAPIHNQINVNTNETVSSDEWQSEEELDDGPTNNRSSARSGRGGSGGTFAERRQLPSRASKDNSLLSIKRRTIMKPAKHTSSLTKDFSNLKPADIKKIYLNKKLTNFRPSSLETIFEEPATTQNNDDTIEEYEQVRFIGARKLRRALTCTDGFVFNKALVKKRRAKIKKTFGRRLSLKKISLEDFLEKLNNSMEEAKTPEPDMNEDMDEEHCWTMDNPTPESSVSSISTAVLTSDTNMNIAPTLLSATTNVMSSAPLSLCSVITTNTSMSFLPTTTNAMDSAPISSISATTTDTSISLLPTSSNAMNSTPMNSLSVVKKDTSMNTTSTFVQSPSFTTMDSTPIATSPATIINTDTSMNITRCTSGDVF